MRTIAENLDVLIPQKAPFVFVDALVYTDDVKTRSCFKVKAGHLLMEGDCLSAAGMVENIAQTAAARVGYIAAKMNEKTPVGFIGAVKNLEVFSLPVAGDLLETEITIANHIFDVTIITGCITCNEEILATCEMKIVINPTTIDENKK
jgi:predicted hotdog family 3-hydroxylacyl-ACP dehydratase